MPARRRLDQALVARGLAPSRSRARALVMAAKVRVAGQAATKAGMLVAEDDEIEIAEAPRFVGRGGDKLAAALEATGLDPRGRVCLDVGASTGGFTDCLLQAGAAAVVAVDVGYGQLDWRLRQNDRVFVLERVNARNLTPGDLPAGLPRRPDLLVIDVSFIGIGKVLPAATSCCADSCEALLLVKPQFECGPEHVGKGGVVVDAGARRAALEKVGNEAIAGGWEPRGAVASPIRGAKGNWECFLYLGRPLAGDEPASLADVLQSIDIPTAREDARAP
jgi:23S rRNA (cytidine1920-2'-O)/16S rRNA (cytidine1409-2'-O)-methyltransferase